MLPRIMALAAALAAVATAHPAQAQVYYYGQDGSVVVDTPQGRFYRPPDHPGWLPYQQFQLPGQQAWQFDQSPGVQPPHRQPPVQEPRAGGGNWHWSPPPAEELARRQETRRNFGLVPPQGDRQRAFGLVPPPPSPNYRSQGLVPPPMR